MRVVLWVAHLLTSLSTHAMPWNCFPSHDETPAVTKSHNNKEIMTTDSGVYCTAPRCTQPGSRTQEGTWQHTLEKKKEVFLRQFNYFMVFLDFPVFCTGPIDPLYGSVPHAPTLSTRYPNKKAITSVQHDITMLH